MNTSKLDFNETFQHVKAFGLDRTQPLASSEFIEVLWRLCKAGAQVNCNIVGFYRCCLCHKELKGKTSVLKCKHELHNECLTQYAMELTDGTMDPLLLATISCQLCNKQLTEKELEAIIGKRHIEDAQMRVSMVLMSKIEEEERAARKKQIQERTYPCPLCEEQFRIQNLITLDCLKETHRFCKECAKASILQVINNGKFSEKDLSCQVCHTPINELLIRQCIPAADFEKLVNLRHKNIEVEGLNIRSCLGYRYRNGNQLMPLPADITKQQYERYQDELERRCHALRAGLRPPEVVGDVEECPGMISSDPNDEGFIKCPVCNLETCIKGCDAAHRGSTCENYRKWKEVTQMSDQKANQVIRQMKMMRCPKCQNIVLKETGCNHITCRCGMQFCYICGRNWAGHNAGICRPPP